MQNNSRNYSGISHALFLNHNIIPFSGCLSSGFIYLPRNDIIKQVTFWEESNSISLILPALLPASISTHLLSPCFRKLFNSSMCPSIQTERNRKEKANEMLSWGKGRSRSKDKIRGKNEKRHNTGRYMPIPSSAKKKIKTNRDRK